MIPKEMIWKKLFAKFYIRKVEKSFDFVSSEGLVKYCKTF
jgi:hypothetical protein